MCSVLRVGPFGKSCQHQLASLTLAVDSPPEHFEPNWRSVGTCTILRFGLIVLEVENLRSEFRVEIEILAYKSTPGNTKMALEFGLDAK